MKSTLLTLALIAGCRDDRPPAPPTPPAPPIVAAVTASADAGPAAADAAAGPVADAAAGVDAGPVAAPTPTGAIRVVLVHDHDLLRSEQRGFDNLGFGLGRGPRPVGLVHASAAEAEVARAHLNATAAGPGLPVAWLDAPVVIALELRPPIGREPKRHGGGLAGIAIFRPPALAPVMVRRMPPSFSDSFSGESATALATWLVTAIAVVTAPGVAP